MKKRILSFLISAAVLAMVAPAWAVNTYCTTAMQNSSGVCLSNGSQPPLSTNQGSGLVQEMFSFNIANTVSGAGFANTDVLKLVPVPGVANQCNLLDIHFDGPALDTGGGMTAKIGDGGSSARYVTGSTSFRSAVDTALYSLNGYVAGSAPHAYTAADTISLVVTAAVTTPATTGILNGWATFYCGANPNIGG